MAGGGRAGEETEARDLERHPQHAGITGQSLFGEPLGSARTWLLSLLVEPTSPRPSGSALWLMGRDPAPSEGR